MSFVIGMVTVEQWCLQEVNIEWQKNLLYHLCHGKHARTEPRHNGYNHYCCTLCRCLTPSLLLLWVRGKGIWNTYTTSTSSKPKKHSKHGEAKCVLLPSTALWQSDDAERNNWNRKGSYWCIGNSNFQVIKMNGLFDLTTKSWHWNLKTVISISPKGYLNS